MTGHPPLTKPQRNLLLRVHTQRYERVRHGWRVSGGVAPLIKLATMRPLITRKYVGIGHGGPRDHLFLTWKGKRELGV